MWSRMFFLCFWLSVIFLWCFFSVILLISIILSFIVIFIPVLWCLYWFAEIISQLSLSTLLPSCSLSHPPETPVILMVDLFTVSHMLLMLLSVFCIRTYLHFTLYIFSDLFSINSLFSCFLYYLNHYIKFLVLDIVFFFF